MDSISSATRSSETAATSSENAATSSESKGHKSVTEDADFISKLPDELLHQILSYVSLREAVRTSILSQRWRYLSSYKPLLRFNWQEMFFTETENYEFWRSHKKPCIIFSTRIVKAINEYIRFYRGEKIDLFEVNFCFCSYHRDYTNSFSGIKLNVDDIDGWINFALGKGVKSLTLFTYCLFDCCKNTNCGRYPSRNTRGCGFDYLFRTEIFDGIAMNLKHLKLGSCELGPNFTNQLSSLETLSLDNVDNLAIYLESMFPFLENLKTLEIINSGLSEKLSLAGLPLLQKFSTLIDRHCLLEEIELSNPNLIEFECLSVYGVTCNFSGAPNLISVSYTVPFLRMALVFTDYPRQCPKVRNLSLVIIDDWAYWAPPRRVERFSQVTDLTLNLNFRRLDFSLVRVMAILKAFPLLQRFVLNMDCFLDLEEEEEEPELTYLPEYLTEITIPKFRFTNNQIKFAIYLLKNASALKKMTVLPRSQTVLSDEIEEMKRELLSRLQNVDHRNILAFV